MWWEAIPVVGKILNGVIGIIDQSVEDKDKANQLKAELTTAFNNADLTKFQVLIESQAKIVLGEIQGQSWLQRNWRPILMVTIIAIVANNFILFPYLSMWTDKVVVLDLPDKLYTLMTTGVGGYIIGRSTEKGIDKWKQSNNK